MKISQIIDCSSNFLWYYIKERLKSTELLLILLLSSKRWQNFCTEMFCFYLCAFFSAADGFSEFMFQIQLHFDTLCLFLTRQCLPFLQSLLSLLLPESREFDSLVIKKTRLGLESLYFFVKFEIYTCTVWPDML